MSGLNIASATGSRPSNPSTFPTPAFQDGTSFRNDTVDMVTATRNTTNNADVVSRLPPSTDFGPQINFTIWLLTALSSAFLALRVYCKFLRHRGLWWDDHLLILSWLSLVANAAFISACINMGFGRPLSQFNMNDLDIFLLFSNLAGSFSILAALWSKTSFAVTVLRISSGWFKALVWFIIITVNACLGVAIAITWAQCTPIEKVWHPHLTGECWPKGVQIKYNIFTAVYSGAMDIVLAILPWKIIWSLTMNRKEKVGVMVAMSMGVFAGVTSIIKVTQLPSISNSTFTESTTQLVILAAAESAITIIAASIPILRALIRDSRPPPGPAEFYHSFLDSGFTDTAAGNSRIGRGSGLGGRGRAGIIPVPTATGNTTSRSRDNGENHQQQQQGPYGWSQSQSTAGSGWDKEEMAAHQPELESARTSSVGRLSRLSRFSGLSVIMLGAERGVGTTVTTATTATTTGSRGANSSGRRAERESEDGSEKKESEARRGGSAAGVLTMTATTATTTKRVIAQTDEMDLEPEERGARSGPRRRQEPAGGIGRAF